MSNSPKRKAGFDGESSERKRRKENHDSNEWRLSSPPPQKAIQDVRDLRSLASSTTLEVGELVSRINRFKSFLESILYAKSQDKSSEISIFVHYLRSQIPEDENHPLSVPDVLKMAHHACQINSENLYASSMIVIALLLKAISGLHDLRETGNSMCRLLLHDDHIKLIERGMSAAKYKEHIISACLRLLREVVLFDGGRATRAVFRQRHITFQRLEVFLTMRGADKEDQNKSRKRISVRNNAISYILANLRLQNQTGKCFILGRNKLVRTLLSDIGDDPPGLVHGILDTLRKDVAEDPRLPLTVKGRLFDDWALHRLVTLYGFKNDAPEDGKPGIRDLAHTLLSTVFVSNDHSLLVALDNENARKALKQDDSDSELDEAMRGSADTGRTRKDLISFLKHLRPHADLKQSDLLISCFQISPGLLQDYFSDVVAFSFDPKLSATWIGYSQFILGIMQQPIPESLVKGNCQDENQRLELLLDHIIPPPLSQKVLTRCFHQNSTLIKFFASRILVAAFDKLIATRNALKLLQTNSGVGSGSSKFETSSRLLDAFSERLPKFNDVASQFKASAGTSIMLRESLSRLLVRYYMETPQLALGEKLDISTALSDSLGSFIAAGMEGKKDDMLSLIIDHLLQIAFRSPKMQWWHKSDSTPLTPFSKLLKAYVENLEDHSQARKFLKSLMEENYLTWPVTRASGLDIIVQFLQNTQEIDSSALYAVLDNCIVRCLRRTVVYSDLLDDLKDELGDEGNEISSISHPDLLMITLMEQLPHLVARHDERLLIIVALFLNRYITFSARRGVSRSLLLLIRDKIQICFQKHGECLELFSKTLEEPFDSVMEQDFNQLEEKTRDEMNHVSAPIVSSDIDAEPNVEIPPGPPVEDKDHRGLTRWIREDIQDAINDGSIAEMILCLCSEFEEIRKQTLLAIGKMMQRLEVSGYSEWRQVHLLAGELRETASLIEPNERLPYVAGVFAIYFLQILTDPLHLMYKKVNTFLNRGPLWMVEKIPSYWIDKILMHPPTHDDGNYQEIEWLLEALTDALRTPQDMEIYRQGQILERLMAVTASPNLPVICYEKFIDLLFRCTYLDGSTTLFTRCGINNWLTGRMANKDDRMRPRLMALRKRVVELSDQK